MSNENISQENAGMPSPKQFRAKFKEILDSETTFGSARCARMELLDSARDLIQEYLNKGCRMVYLHGRLKEAGYSGSRKELAEWLVDQGLWEKREISEKGSKKEENLKAANSDDASGSAKNERKKDLTSTSDQHHSSQSSVNENDPKTRKEPAASSPEHTPEAALHALSSLRQPAQGSGKVFSNGSAVASQVKSDSGSK